MSLTTIKIKTYLKNHAKNNHQVTFSNNLKSNQIFIILEVLRRSVYRVVGPISADWRPGITAAKKRRRSGEALRLATLSDLTDPRFEPQTSRIDSVRLTTDLTCLFLFDHLLVKQL